MRIAILDDYLRVSLRMAEWGERLPDHEVVAFTERIDDDEALVAALAGFDVVVVMRERTRLPGRILGRLKALRLIVTTGSQNAAIDVEAARVLGIDVASTGTETEPTAELTWALVMGLLRHTASNDADVRAGTWQRRLGSDLHGSVYGVVGLGKVGTLVARYASAFGMNVLAWSPRLTAERSASAGARFVSKAQLFSEADVVSLHLSLNESTRGIVGVGDIAAMARQACLVNTARGALVTDDALRAALSPGGIAGVGLDVFDQEPLGAGHWLLESDRVLLSPHVGYVSTRGMTRYYREALEDIEAWFAGSPIRLI